MPHRLLLLRHAKSAWPEGVVDPRRPLNERGEVDARAVGVLLRERGWSPDLVLCSPARRTRQTWSLAAENLSPPPVLLEEQALYEATVADVLDVVRKVEEEVGTLIVVGHNPTTAELADGLSGPGSDRDALDRLRAKYPTAGLAVLSVGGPWAALEPGTCVLEAFEVPRGDEPG